jgi:hypothetical protein
MAIYTVARWKFEEFLTLHPILEKSVGEVTDWFVTDDGNVLGILTRGELTGHWGYVLFERSRRGDYELLDLRRSLDSWRSATTMLLYLMGLAETRRREHPAHTMPAPPLAAAG